MKRLALILLLGSALAGPAAAVVTSTPVGNVSYTVLSTDQRILYSVAFTAPRTLTLPSAGATCIGQTCPVGGLDIFDSTGAISSTNTLTITPASGETINNSTASVVIDYPYARVTLIPISGSNWQLVNAGNVGQFVSGRTDQAAAATAGNPAANTSIVTSAPLLTTTVPNIVTQVLLSAGDWDCGGMAAPVGTASTSYTLFSAWTSTAAIGSAAPIPTVTAGAALNPSFSGIQTAAIVSPTWSLSVPRVRYSLSAATSVYLMADATFTLSASSVAGAMQCRSVH